MLATKKNRKGVLNESVRCHSALNDQLFGLADSASGSLSYRYLSRRRFRFGGARCRRMRVLGARIARRFRYFLPGSRKLRSWDVHTSHAARDRLTAAGSERLSP